MKVGWLRSNWRKALLVALTAVILSAAIGIYLLGGSKFFGTAGQWFNTAGLLLDISGLIQLQASGFFERLVDYYANENKFPYGPPSRSQVNIEIMHARDSYVTKFYSLLFHGSTPGFYLIVAGCLLQLLGTWSG